MPFFEDSSKRRILCDWQVSDKLYPTRNLRLTTDHYAKNHKVSSLFRALTETFVPMLVRRTGQYQIYLRKYITLLETGWDTGLSFWYNHSNPKLGKKMVNSECLHSLKIINLCCYLKKKEDLRCLLQRANSLNGKHTQENGSSPWLVYIVVINSGAGSHQWRI